MHTLLLVIGDQVHRRLLAFRDGTKVAPYRVYVEGDRLRKMADHFGVPEDDVDSLLAKLPEWNGCKGELHDGRISYWLRDNPDGKFDWYRIGGRFAGYLHLQSPRSPSLLGRLLGKSSSDRANRALKRDIVVEDVLAHPPFAMLIGSTWHSQGWAKERPDDAQWKEQFAFHFSQVGPGDLITVVDTHS